VLGALSKHGTVLYHLGPTTGRWKYNGTISLLAGCRPFYWRKGSDGSADSAIEYKHQNVGAVMIESGFACIRGYKPTGNSRTLFLIRQVRKTGAVRGAGLVD
jgi:hypothetical protein